MLQNLLFYASESLGDVEAVFYFDSELPLFWDKGNKCIVINLSTLDFVGSTIKFYHDKGFMRFNEPWRIEEFCALYGEGSHEIYKTFLRDWGDWDFATIMKFGIKTKLFSSEAKDMIAYYPEFPLDMGEFIEERVGIELQDGMGIIPCRNADAARREFSKIEYDFLTREMYLMCEEILLSEEYSTWVEDTSLMLLKSLFEKHFDVSTLKLKESKVTGNAKFKGFITNIEKNITYNEPNSRSKLNPHVCQDVGYFLNTSFTAKISDAEIDSLLMSNSLSSISRDLRAGLLKRFYGSRIYPLCTIELDQATVSLTVPESQGDLRTLLLRTTVILV